MCALGRQGDSLTRLAWASLILRTPLLINLRTPLGSVIDDVMIVCFFWRGRMWGTRATWASGVSNVIVGVVAGMVVVAGVFDYWELGWEWKHAWCREWHELDSIIFLFLFFCMGECKCGNRQIVTAIGSTVGLLENWEFFIFYF